MARKAPTDLSAWPSLTLEGNLIAPAMVAQIAEPKDDAESRERYGIRKGLSIREEISTAFRVGQSHYDAFAKLEKPSADATRRFIRDFLKETFSFDDLAPGDGVTAFVAGGDRLPIVVVPPSDEKLDRRSETLSLDRSRSPAFALQDYLNEHEDALWGLATNDRLIRLMRDNASLTRPAFIEADLAQIFSNEDAASFSVLWLIIHRSRFGAEGTPATNCALERWRDAGAREGEAARDRLAGQVQLALKVLGSGFLEANPDLAKKLSTDEIDLTGWFNELLRLVYRLIFLMVAEDRNLLHPDKAKADARKLYAKGYSLAALRAQCVRRSTWDRHVDRYEGLKIVFRALAHGEQALGLPALGGLFGRDKLPFLEPAALPNRALMEALYRLAWLKDKSGVVPINWRAMETEELGSVYETLLELQPQLGEDGRTLLFATDAAEQKGNQRKTTGSYYTPDSLVQALLDTALDPILDRTAGAADPEQGLLSLSIIDPACGSGHFLLAAARRIATRLARIRAEGTPSLADFRHALRDVARACIHGVDRNPMAVELTKVALWIETVDPGLPLGFFDAQIRCGDALLGVFDIQALEDGIPDAAYKPLTGDDKVAARHYALKNKSEKNERENIASGFGFNRQQDLTKDFSELRAMPETTLAEIEAKAARLKRLTGEGAASWDLSRAADLYVAAFLTPKTVHPDTAGPDGLPRRGAETIPTSGTLWELLRGRQPHGLLTQTAERALDDAHAFHWPLEFPDVMAKGGFDVVLGNPPWERIKLQEKEFFATRDPEIANAPNKAARDRLIKALRGTPRRVLFEDFQTAKRLSEAQSAFARADGKEGGRFPLTGTGDVNTYALFAELFSDIIASRGRSGLILPLGIATDDTTKAFFGRMISDQRLTSLLAFENEEFIFRQVHHAFRFALLTMRGTASRSEAEFAFFCRQADQLTDARRRFTLSPADIALINPNTRTCPIFRTGFDAELTKKLYSRTSILIDESRGEAGNPWGITFQRMFDMSNDSGLFVDNAALAEKAEKPNEPETRGIPDFFALAEAEGLSPLYEAKMIHHYDHRWASYQPDGRDADNLDPAAKADPGRRALPRYWVDTEEVDSRLTAKGWNHSWLMGWRDITLATNERTVIGAVIPRVAVGNNLPIFFPNPKIRPNLYASLLGCMSSLILDYNARWKVGGSHLNFFIAQQLPVLPPTAYTPADLDYIVPRVLYLTYTAWDLAPFARDLGYDGEPFVWNEQRRALVLAELDAFYARAYGLDRDELRYILDPADIMGEDYPSETFRVLKEKEIRLYGEYRTRRLVLEAWDRLAADGDLARTATA